MWVVARELYPNYPKMDKIVFRFAPNAGEDFDCRDIKKAMKFSTKKEATEYAKKNLPWMYYPINESEIKED